METWNYFRIGLLGDTQSYLRGLVYYSTVIGLELAHQIPFIFIQLFNIMSIQSYFGEVSFEVDTQSYLRGLV